MAFRSDCTCTWYSSDLGRKSTSEKRGGSRRSRLGRGPCWGPVGSKSCSLVLKGLGREVVALLVIQPPPQQQGCRERLGQDLRESVSLPRLKALQWNHRKRVLHVSRSCSLRNLVICSRMIWCKNFLACNFEAISTVRACRRC